jgi:hypothetical protein
MESELLLYLANGGTTVRNMAGYAKHLELKKAVEERRVQGPRIFTSGGFFYGRHPKFIEKYPEDDIEAHWEFGSVIKNPRGAVTQVRRHRDEGFNYIQIWSYLAPEVYWQAVETSQSLEIPVIGHVPEGVRLLDVLTKRSQISIEHLQGYDVAIEDESSPLRSSSDIWVESFCLRLLHQDEAKAAQVVQATVDSGIWNVPTLTITRNLGLIAQGEDLSNSAGAQYMDPCWIENQKKLAGDVVKDAAGWAAHPNGNLIEGGYKALQALVLRLHKSGAKIVAGSDTNIVFVIPGFSLHRELELLVGCGLSPFDALQAGTVNAAELLGHNGGAVEEGLPADLCIVDSNPLDNIRATRELSGVVAQGLWYSREDLDALLNKVKHIIKTTPCEQSEPAAVTALNFPCATGYC